MFFFKKKEIVVDCFTSDEIVYNNFKPDRAVKFIPEWWKSIPSNEKVKVNNDPQSSLHIKKLTVKDCNGFRDLFQEGFILPFWVDAQIEMLDDSKFYVSGHAVQNVKLGVDYHGRDQTTSKIYTNSGQIKLISPWLLEEKSGVKFSWMPCMWHNNMEDMHILTGVVDYKTQKSTHINMFMRKNSIVKINAGDGLVHMIPLSDKKVKLKHHLLSPQEYQLKVNHEMDAVGYANPKKVKQVEEKKCPFGFGR